MSSCSFVRAFVWSGSRASSRFWTSSICHWIAWAVLYIRSTLEVGVGNCGRAARSRAAVRGGLHRDGALPSSGTAAAGVGGGRRGGAGGGGSHRPARRESALPDPPCDGVGQADASRDGHVSSLLVPGTGGTSPGPPLRGAPSCAPVAPRAGVLGRPCPCSHTAPGSVGVPVAPPRRVGRGAVGGEGLRGAPELGPRHLPHRGDVHPVARRPRTGSPCRPRCRWRRAAGAGRACPCSRSTRSPGWRLLRRHRLRGGVRAAR